MEIAINAVLTIVGLGMLCVGGHYLVDGGVLIAKKLDKKTIIFVPDTNLGKYVQRFISDKNILLWPGICPTHHKITKEHILNLKKKHPNAEVIVHPECNPDVIDIDDFVFSTHGMINHVAQSSSKEFIVGTEKDLCYRLKKLNPQKTFFPIDIALCPNMKKLTLQKILTSLETMKPRVELSEDIIKKAAIPLQKMVDFGRGD